MPLAFAVPAASGVNLATWSVAAVATAGVILRPWRVPEAVWALAGAVLLVLAGLLPWADAARAVGKGNDVYLFLGGMMVLAELARREGLFDYVAARAVQRADGSAGRLFALVYGVGVLVTVFMSNDATAVVLTPAVYAAAKKAGVKPLPYLFACALVANAASFVLPISNPANLVVFGDRLPALLPWLAQFIAPSLAAIAGTYFTLRLLHAGDLAGTVHGDIDVPPLTATGKLAFAGIGAVALALLAASAAGWPLGWPTLVASGAAAAAVLVRKRESPWVLLREVSWSVLLLVAALFVLVEALAATGVVQTLSAALQSAVAAAPRESAWGAGIAVAVLCNLMNNLPAGLVAGSVVAAADVPTFARSAIAVGIDLGPNLSVTGSLATILWLIAIRREGENVSAMHFLRVGAIVMPVSLLLALGALMLQNAF
ncbi:SLC13 family permease [Caenimonas terrae]|uniref:SLC13 family permease n=1 Tax=Caenimonas terrae TaxID=696074 RepID=A0ABW0NBC5_9BURK